MSFIERKERGQMPGLDGRGAPVHMGVVEIDNDQCTGCQLCVETCPGKALEMSGKQAVRMIEADLVPCVACGDCVAICQPGAITVASPHHYSGFFRFLHRGDLSLPRVF